MAFPPKDPNAPPRPKPDYGPNKSRKYAAWYVSRQKGGADDTEWLVMEVRGQHLRGVHNAVVRKLRVDLDRPELKSGDVLIMEAHLLPPRTSLDAYLTSLGYGDTEEE